MLESISWADYIQYSAAATLSYYGFAGAVLYRKDLLQFIRQPKGIRSMKDAGQTHPFHGTDQLSSNIHPDHPLMPRLHECVDEIRALLLQLANEEPTPTTLTFALQRLLHKYQDLKHSSFQESVSELIREQSEIECGIPLDPAAIQQLWQ